jgi:hypothetical protein
VGINERDHFDSEDCDPGGRDLWNPKSATELIRARASVLLVIGSARSAERTMGPWLQIPMKARLSVCAFILLAYSCVQVKALLLGDPLSTESYRMCIGLRNGIIGQYRTKGCIYILKGSDDGV